MEGESVPEGGGSNGKGSVPQGPVLGFDCGSKEVGVG